MALRLLRRHLLGVDSFDGEIEHLQVGCDRRSRAVSAQVEVALRPLAAMALEAVRLEEGPDVAHEALLERRRARIGGEDKGAGRETEEKETSERPSHVESCASRTERVEGLIRSSRRNG